MYVVCLGLKGIIFVGDFLLNVKVYFLFNLGALFRLLLNVSSMDGCEVLIVGL